MLDIAVWNNKEMSRTVPVRPDGRISLPLLNDVQAAGLTPTQLKDALHTALAPYIPTPELSVIVREVHSIKVAVIGEVKTPGRYEFGSVATVLDVLAMAGGLTEYAVRDRVVILRREGSTTRQIPFNYAKLTRNDATEGRSGQLLHQTGRHHSGAVTMSVRMRRRLSTVKDAPKDAASAYEFAFQAWQRRKWLAILAFCVVAAATCLHNARTS